MTTFASSPRFLRAVLWADAASCLATGTLQLAALDALSRLFGLPQGLLLDTGVFLVAYALLAAWTATREVPPRKWVALFAIGNVAWAIGCAIAVFTLQPATPGIAWIAVQAAAVLVLADLQWMGLRRGAVGARAALG
ncbi:hypothetical protein [Ramlibacter sp. Leaf400]|uniref:hypothetical protein n=1 Tax=Ramlibacter sp. Leaf400 TaxID=1736365 RepID=UPI000701B3F7|nr:hypothetical protein [Ramlibacter sp. Leaf400]KQT08775.1 hypothetical protein ASG30_14915 [Ramlibacter sp. Leaf400]